MQLNTFSMNKIVQIKGKDKMAEIKEMDKCKI
jgi:hypothetical protein